MDNALYYLAINRQTGLAAEMDLIANNIANMDTTGFRREGLAFTEFVVAAEQGESVSMADLGARFASDLPGTQTITGGRFDLAIEGPGYFALQNLDRVLLTRAGAFQLSQDGFLTNTVGDRVLDAGQAAIAIPIEAKDVVISADGTVSANGQAIAQIALFDAPGEELSRFGDTAFEVDPGAIEAVVDGQMRQGALERSNVDPVIEIARMIEVSRAYEMAQSVVEDEDERIREAIQTLGRST
ncbi:MAG: flagellar hook-basal body complex protein [Pseudomonadota bacterium]